MRHMLSLTNISKGITPFSLRGNITIFIYKLYWYASSEYLGRTGRRRNLTAEDLFRQQVNPYEICGGGSDIRTSSPLSSLFPHAKVIPPTLRNYFNPNPALIARKNVRRVGNSEQNNTDVRGSVHCSIIHIKIQQIEQCIKILFHIYMKLSIFRKTHCPSSGA